MECDSCAAIEGARITNLERKELKELIYKVINYVDNKI